MKYVKENTKEFEYSNIIKWHEKGYTGKGIKIANMEDCNPDGWYFNGQVKDPFNNKLKNFGNYHGNQTANVLLQVAPDLEIHILSNGGFYTNDEITGKFIEESIPYMISEGIVLVNASLSGINNEHLAKHIANAQKEKVSFISSAGNRGINGVMGYAEMDEWISVGAVHLDNCGKINIADYSSRGDKVDFTQFSGIYVNDIRDNKKNRVIHVTGTSFSSPMLCGMLALVQQLFIEKTGQALNQKQLYQFMLDNSIDLGVEGKDEEYGNGLFVLPNPDDIDISKYVDIEVEDIPEEEDIIKFPDVPQGRWSSDSIDLISALEIMKGYPDGEFKPTKPVTREELATVLADLYRSHIIKNNCRRC